MTDEITIPIGEIRPTCPHCGAGLLIEHDGIEAKPEDRVFCAQHGTVGIRGAIRAQVLEQNLDKIHEAAIEHAADVLRDAIKSAGFKIE